MAMEVFVLGEGRLDKSRVLSRSIIVANELITCRRGSVERAR